MDRELGQDKAIKRRREKGKEEKRKEKKRKEKKGKLWVFQNRFKKKFERVHGRNKKTSN